MRLSLALLLFAACRTTPSAQPAPADAPKMTTPPTTAPAAPPAKPLRSRAEFVRSLATIKPGASGDEVLRALGQPDDVRTERDPGGITAARTVEIWRWGTCGHLTFATLGSVHIQADHRVQYVFGAAGAPPAGFDEAELRLLLRLVAAVPSYNDTLDPRLLIRAVNALQPLGKERALAVIDEYLRVSSDLDDDGREGLFLLDRALFDPPAGASLPEMMVGGPSLQPPKDPLALPRWPLAIASDIPLKLVSGYSLAGMAAPPESDVAWFRAHAALRAAPLAPPALPLDAIDAFVEGPLAQAVPLDDRLRIQLYDQALRLVGTASRPASTVNGWFTYGPDVAGRWKATRAELAKLAPAWSAERAAYTRADGTTLEAPTGAERVWWELGLAGTTRSRLTLERREGDLVDLELRLELREGASLAAATVRVLDGGAAVAEIPIAAMTARTSTTGSVSGQRAHVPLGHAVRLELVAAGKIVAGPTLELPEPAAPAQTECRE